MSGSGGAAGRGFAAVPPPSPPAGPPTGPLRAVPLGQPGPSAAAGQGSAAVPPPPPPQHGPLRADGPHQQTSVPAAVGPSAAGSAPTLAADSKSRATQGTGSRSRRARGGHKSAARAQAASATPAAALPPPPTFAALPGMPPSPGLLSRAAAAVTGLFGRQEAMTPPRHRADSAHAHQAVDGPLREVHRTRSPALRTGDGHSGPPSRDLSPVRRSLRFQGAFGGSPSRTFTLRPVPGSPPPAPMHGAAAADIPPLPASPSRSERSSMTGAVGHAAAADDDGHLSASFADIAAIAAAPPLEQC